MRIIFLFAIALISFSLANPVVSQSTELNWMDLYENREFTLRPSINQNPIIYSCEDACVTMLCEGDLFPLLAPEIALIYKVKEKDDGKRLELHLRSAHLGNGKLVIEAESNQKGILSEKVVAWLIALLDANEDIPLFVAHQERNVLHYRGCNHNPPLDESRYFSDTNSAIEFGLRLCPACFSPIHRIPDYREEMQLGEAVASQIRGQYMTIPDDASQAHLQALGNRVLDRWPFELRGYNYRFTLIDSDQANATSCPGGWIFLNNALVDLCETDQELEAVIAHEVAHVEMRHGIRQLRLARRNAMIAGFFAGAIAVATANDGESAQVVGAMASIIFSTAMELALQGYSQDFEQESDAYAINYLSHNYGSESRRDYADLMRKLRYMTECESSERYRHSEYSTHPNMEDRVAFAEKATIRFYDPAPVFSFSRASELILEVNVGGITEHKYRRIETMAQRSTRVEVVVQGYELRMFISVKTTNALGDPMEFKDLQFRIGDEWYKVDNREDTVIYPSHSVSACLIKESSSPIGVDVLIPEEIKLSDGTRLSLQSDKAVQSTGDIEW